jgi:alpha-tubulin suppressor-like RCC1 family protein
MKNHLCCHQLTSAVKKLPAGLCMLFLGVGLVFFSGSCQQSSGDDSIPNGGPSPSPTPTPKEPPTVVSTSPEKDATSISITAPITVTFSQAMDASTITAATFTVSNASGEVTYSDKTATFTPSSALNYANTYTATITTGAKDENGTALTEAYSWSFTTASGNLSLLAVEGGDEHTCALLANGTVKCWGHNTYGQLGLEKPGNVGDSASSMGDNLSAVDLGTNRYALQIAVGGNHTCARLDNGSVKCWGYNLYGQLGQDHANPIGLNADEMGDNLVPVNLGKDAGGNDYTAIGIAAGYNHTCVRLHDGKVKCWGSNHKGQLGQENQTDIGKTTGDMGVLGTIDLPHPATDLVAGESHTCVRTVDGTTSPKVYCWGRNEWGQLGIDSTTDIGGQTGEMGTSLRWVDLGTDLYAVQLAAGLGHTCARLHDSTIKCWGYNDMGQLGQGDTNNRGDHLRKMSTLSAVNLGSGRTAVRVVTGMKHTCAVIDNGQIKCWGDNRYGQLGQQRETPSSVGTDSTHLGDELPYSSLGTDRTALGLTAGSDHTCVRLDNGRTKCWGKNNKGQLGQENDKEHGKNKTDMGDNLTAIHIGTGEFSAVKLSVGYSHSCAGLGYSNVKCWGRNAYGQLGQEHAKDIGDGPNEMGNKLLAIDVNGKVVEVAVGKNHSCARLDNGSVKCWGYNAYGQLGIDDSTTDIGTNSGEMGENLKAVNLGTDRKAVEIAAGGDHTCARLDNSDVKCWGFNQEGQLGQGHTDPIGDSTGDMAGLEAIRLGGKTQQIAAGEEFTCALLVNGKVKCWGLNSNGQLGQEDNSSRGGAENDMNNLNPVNLGTGRTATQLVAGYGHVCALLDNSTVKCWGHNGGRDGKLGLGLGLYRESVGTQSDDMGDHLNAVALGTTRKATQIAAGSFHTCARLDNGSVKCWGNNDYGQLGQENDIPLGASADDMGDNLKPVNLGELTVNEVTAGYLHNCARLVNGKVKCWGGNQYGQLGLGHTTTRGKKTGDMGDELPYVGLGSQ